MNSCTVLKPCEKADTKVYERPQCMVRPCNLTCDSKYVQPPRPEPFKPKPSSFKNEGPVACDTVYNSSFSTYVCGPRQKPVRHNDHLIMAGRSDYKTVNMMSYPIHCPQKVQKIVPRDHCLAGKGPMTKLTTNNHDFYVPCGNRGRKILPHNNLRVYENCPMASLTTNHCSYQPVCADPVQSYKPNERYSAPEGNMDTVTVQKASYTFKCPGPKLKTPWATKMEYCKPRQMVENCTVYNQSFVEPGHYESIDGGGCNGPQIRTCGVVGCLAAKAEAKVKMDLPKAHHY